MMLKTLRITTPGQPVNLIIHKTLVLFWRENVLKFLINKKHPLHIFVTRIALLPEFCIFEMHIEESLFLHRVGYIEFGNNHLSKFHGFFLRRAAQRSMRLPIK